MLKEIKTKPQNGKPRILEQGARLPRGAARRAAQAAGQKARQSLQEAAPGNRAEDREGSASQAGADTAGRMAGAARDGSQTALRAGYRGGKALGKAVGKGIRERRERFRGPEEIPRSGGETISPNRSAAFRRQRGELAREKRLPGLRSDFSPGKRAAPSHRETLRAIKGKPVKTVKSLRRSVKESGRGIKTAQRTAQAAQKTARAAAKTAQRAAQAARMAAKAAITGARAAIRAIAAAAKATVAAVKGLVSLILAGGWVAVLVILLICLIALVAGSVFGVFMGAEPTGTGVSIPEAVELLNGEYREKLENIEDAVPHDRREIIASDGSAAIPWEDVLAVFSSRITGDEAGSQAVSLDSAQLDLLRQTLWDMNAVSYTTRTETHKVKVEGAEGEMGRIETVTETVLEIHITRRAPREMEIAYQFNSRQSEYLSLMLDPQNANLWAQLLGGFTSGGGQVIDPDTGWEGTGPFQWPLPQDFPISSPFGRREDPFTGEIAYHSGTDIAAPKGTPILAAAEGTVSVANGTDSWGGSYGYHIKLSHSGGYETLYAHCSSICVTPGQEVRQGEVIGYVGSTGNSSGNHLHFEVRRNGECVDGMGFFQQSAGKDAP